MNAIDTKPDQGKNTTPLRPPWALPEWVFRQRCDTCGACIQACREGILGHGLDGLPLADFRFGGCDFCGACVAACPTHALRATGRERFSPFRFRLKISSDCLARDGEPCSTCSEFCDNFAIQFDDIGAGQKSPRVDESRCNGCGHCVGPCPVNAIEVCGLPMPGPGQA